MMNKILVDTNVLAYAYDRTAQAKQIRAKAVLDALAQSGRGVLTAQILAEFFVVTTGKLAEPITQAEAFASILNYQISWEIFELTGMVVLEAVRGVRDYQLSYWDSQLWAAARMNQVPIILSEDFNSGSVIEGVRFINPFSHDFLLSQLI
jgi:predicted nucleic acid-binding protein